MYHSLDEAQSAVKVLVVEDEKNICDMLRMALGQKGMEVSEAADAEIALKVIATDRPDLLLIDWNLPGISGIELVQKLRKDPMHRQLPMIMLTARGTEEDRIQGLDYGADDYITKPFSPRELASRINALLRRVTPDTEDSLLTIGPMRINHGQNRFYLEGEEIKLSPAEFRLISFLMSHPDRLFSRSQLLDYVWGDGKFIGERTVDVHIRRLRRLLELKGHEQLIETVRSRGYRLVSSP
ncbi:MAG: response regulator [Gammaproteobacteria bacterium]|nr:response regulator [Gammaproteobacteria bacterium]